MAIKVDIIDAKTNKYYQEKLAQADKDFSWSEQQLACIDKIFAKYPKKQSAIMPLLEYAQEQFLGWLPQNILQLVADTLNLPLLKVQEVASYYHMFNLQPVGKYHIKVCTSCSCVIAGSDEILQELNNQVGELVDGISENGLFSISQVECLGACHEAPVMQINQDYKTNLTIQQVKDLIKELS